ncbi:MAG: glycerol-3-phosphate acyltransferase [Dehalococcoidia bacterium]|jgi:glycerol-3-phosphate acyltransferase PlsY|nr:glycerol-3-phosphate acyltransferase [Dehalococcoidia bacterium]MDP6782726.1 glycerol-3-phosphate acyltransferase [Dehalococcoidia bacterium]
MPLSLLLLVPVAYLLGAIPQVYLLGRMARRDVRKEGDLHQALWGASRPLGVVGIVGDMAKGPIPVAAAWLLGAKPWLIGTVGIAVVIGQMWPVFIPSTGGKGNTTGLFMAFALAPGLITVALAPILLSLIIRTAARKAGHHSVLSGPPSNSLPLGMLTAFSLLPLAAFAAEGRATAITLTVLWSAILLRRLTAGLKADLQLSPGKSRVVINRLLYDRSAAELPQVKGR